MASFRMERLVRYQDALPMKVTGISNDSPPYRLHVEGCADVNAKTVIVATGAQYRALSLNNFDEFEGRGIYYAATAVEGNFCYNEDVAIVGGGNSAGQAAVFLSTKARHVFVIVRGDGLGGVFAESCVLN